MTSTGKVHVRRIIVVEYDTDRPDYDVWDEGWNEWRPVSDDQIRLEISAVEPHEMWPDLGGLVTSSETKVTFK